MDKDRRFSPEQNPRDYERRLAFLNGEKIMISLDESTRERFDEIFKMIDRKILDNEGKIRSGLRKDQVEDYIEQLQKIISAFRGIEDFPQHYLREGVTNEEQAVEALAQEIIGLAIGYQEVLRNFLGESFSAQTVAEQNEDPEAVKKAKEFDARFRKLVEAKIQETDGNNKTADLSLIDISPLEVLLSESDSVIEKLALGGFTDEEDIIKRRIEPLIKKSREIIEKVKRAKFEKWISELKGGDERKTFAEKNAYQKIDFLVNVIVPKVDTEQLIDAASAQLSENITLLEDLDVPDEFKDEGDREIQEQVEKAKRAQEDLKRKKEEKEKVLNPDILENSIKDIKGLTLLNDADYASVSLKELKQKKKDLEDAGVASGLNLAEHAGYKQALDRIERFIKVRSEVERLTYEELVEEIAGRDVWNHASFQAAGAEPRNLDLYQRVFGIKGVSLLSAKEGETSEERKERLRWKVKLQLDVVKNLLTPANKGVYIQREKLFEVLEQKGVVREEVIEAITCQEDYGEDVQKIIEHLLKEGTKPSSPIYYNVLISESYGATRLTEYLNGTFFKSLKNKFGEKKALEVLDFVNLLFFSYNLIDVIYAQLVAQTMTKGHSRGDKKDRTLITRPDIACVQRATRRSKLTDWSLRALPFFDEPFWDKKDPTEVDEAGRRIRPGNPLNIGPTAAKNHQLKELRKKQILFKAAQNGRKSLKKRIGKIRSSDMFNPLFADMWQFALPQKGEYVVSGNTIFGKEGKLGKVGQVQTTDKKLVSTSTRVADTSKYGLAEGGWEGMWSVTFKSIGGVVNEHLIEKTLEEWGASASNAKEFPGSHMEDTVEVLLTDLIERLFSVFYTGIENRQTVYRKVVEKIFAWYDGGSLAPFRTQLQSVIKNITRDGENLDLDALEKSVSGHHGDKFKMMSAKLHLDEVLMPLTIGKRRERMDLMNFVFHEEGYPIPNMNILTGTVKNFNPLRSQEKSDRMQWYRDVVNMRNGVEFPDLEIDDDGDFIAKEGEKKDH